MKNVIITTPFYNFITSVSDATMRIDNLSDKSLTTKGPIDAHKISELSYL